MFHVSKMTILLYISALMLFMFACGMQAPKGDFTRALYVGTQAEASTPVPSVEMVVTGSLNIRADHTEESADIGDLFYGDIVTCKLPFTVVGESIWCLHERGWSNVRWLEVR